MSQAAVRFEGDVGRVDETFHLLHALATEMHGDDAVRVPVALQQRHVCVGAAGRGLTTREIRIRISTRLQCTVLRTRGFSLNRLLFGRGRKEEGRAPDSGS